MLRKFIGREVFWEGEQNRRRMVEASESSLVKNAVLEETAF